MLKRAASIILMASFASAGGFLPALAEDEAIPGLDAFVVASMKSRQVPGVAVGVLKDGKVLVAKGYGVRSIDTQLPVDERTIFSLGSMTKAFTAAACGILVDDRKVTWDTRMQTIFPRFSLYDHCAAKKASLRDVLCMRIGLPTISTLVAFAGADKDIFRMLPHVKPVYDFRSGWQYSNECYRIAGESVRKLTGDSWHNFVQARILTPLEMTSTTTNINQIRGSNVAAPHGVVNGKLRPLQRFHLKYGAAAGSIDSNVIDTLNWLTMQVDEGAFHGKQIVSKQSMQAMHAPQTPVKLSVTPGSVKEFDSYGFGWVVQDVNGTEVDSHGGNILGMASNAVVVPSKKLAVVVLCNREGTDERDIVAKKIMLHYLEPDKEASVTPEATEVPEENKQQSSEARIDARLAKGTSRLVGVYHNSPFGDMVISRNKSASAAPLVITYGDLVGAVTPIDRNKFKVDWSVAITDGKEFTFTDSRGNGTLAKIHIDKMDFVRHDSE